LYSITKNYAGCSNWVEFGKVVKSTRTGLLSLRHVPQKVVEEKGPVTSVAPDLDKREGEIFVQIDGQTGFGKRKHIFSCFKLWTPETETCSYFDQGD
jgi:hypothetical protein